VSLYWSGSVDYTNQKLLVKSLVSQGKEEEEEKKHHKTVRCSLWKKFISMI
jgi:hypothetical protein